MASTLSHPCWLGPETEGARVSRLAPSTALGHGQRRRERETVDRDVQMIILDSGKGCEEQQASRAGERTQSVSKRTSV